MSSAIKVTDVSGFTVGSRVVPFGRPITLENNSVGVTVQQVWELLNFPTDLEDTDPDFATNFPGWVLQPDGSYRIVQSGPTFPAVGFTPDISGDYRIRLTAFQPSGDPELSKVVVRVPDQYSGEFVPAAGMTTEADQFRGWAQDRNQSIKSLSRRVGKGLWIRVRNITGVMMGRGNVARITGVEDAHTADGGAVPPGTSVKPERIASVRPGNLADDPGGTGLYCVLDEAIASQRTGWAIRSGLFTDSVYDPIPLYTTIYLGPGLGTQSDVPSAVKIGKVANSGSSPLGALMVEMTGGSSGVTETCVCLEGDAETFGGGAPD